MYTVENYSATKNEICPFAMTRTDLERIMLSEVSQAEEDEDRMISLIWESKGHKK